MTLSCLKHVKRTGDTNKRPSAPPCAVFAYFTGDRSGSMAHLAKESAQGAHDFVKTQCESAKKNGQKGFLGMTTFDDTAEVILDNVPMDTVQFSMARATLAMQPRGATRLFDTAIEDLARLQRYAREWKNNLPPDVKKLNPKVVMVWALFTDGAHNTGSFTADDMNRAVTMARKNGVICYFLAANQDAMQAGRAYGFSTANAMEFAPTASTTAAGLNAINTCIYRSTSTGVPCAPTQLMREVSCPQGPTRGATVPTGSIAPSPAVAAAAMAPPPPRPSWTKAQRRAPYHPFTHQYQGRANPGALATAARPPTNVAAALLLHHNASLRVPPVNNIAYPTVGLLPVPIGTMPPPPPPRPWPPRFTPAGGGGRGVSHA